MKVVIDTNVWVSGLLWSGAPSKILQLAHAGTIHSYVSIELLAELEATLNRLKFSSRLSQRMQTARSLSVIAATISQTVEIDEISIEALRDSADTKIIATAIAANADTIVTGDLDLLVLESFQNIAISTPSRLLEIKQIEAD
ncbi:MAG: putative toxin-antitoxin system toxin component, PIN family [Cyanobacteria bacterium P01_D01_bin.1]